MVRVCGRPAVEAIAVRSDSPYETLDDLVAAIKENPGDFIVPASIGATSHYACLLMEKACGVELNIVNSGASSDRTAGLKGGNFEFIINPYGTMKSFIDSGDFRILATVGEERSSQFPDIPTAKELGYICAAVHRVAPCAGCAGFRVYSADCGRSAGHSECHHDSI